MSLYPCSRGCYFAERLRDRVEDPYHVQCTDYTVDRVFPATQVQEFVEWLSRTFDSFRTRLQLDGAGELRAALCDTVVPVEIIPCSDEVADIPESRLFCRQQLDRIDLVAGRPFCAFYFTDARHGRSVLRLLYSHFAVDAASRRTLDEARQAYFRGTMPVAPADGYVAWMDTCWRYAIGDRGAAEVERWHAQTPAFAPSQQLALQLAGARRHHCQLQITTETVTALTSRCRMQWRCLLVDAVGAAIFAALARAYGLDHIGVAWTGHGRHLIDGKAFVRTVGWLSDYHPLAVPVIHGTKSALIEAVRRALLQLPSGGAAFRWVTNFAPGARDARLEHNLRSPFRLNFRQSALPAPRLASSTPPQGTEPEINTQSHADVSPRELDVYMTVDIGVASKVSLILTGGVPIEHADLLLRCTHECLTDFAFGEHDSLVRPQLAASACQAS